jgi:cobyrinic acid a,c-diamide synthase
MIAAARSGAGKTTVTLGLLAAWRRRGVVVRAAKSGPDYIDPAFHAAACGAPGVNLDSWAMPPPLLDALLADLAAGADAVVIESAMGLFDGVDAPPGRTGAAADLAARFALPVVLVLDIAGQAQSAAAVARGFAAHRPDVRVAGVILNRVASARHRAMAAGAIEAIGLPVLGALPREPALAMPERHLGLVQAEELPRLRDHLSRLADAAEAHLDLAAILALAGPPRLASEPAATALPPPGQRIALARDAAFSFTYPHVLAGWRRAGAEIVAFSPLLDQPPPDDCDVCWLPGGYPELHAGRLAAAAVFRAGLARFATTRPVHGECGGFMVLGQRLEDADGVWHPMTGLLGHATSFARRRLHLGYREARLRVDAPIGPAGGVVRGHEFHYATLMEAADGQPLADLIDGQGAALGGAGERRGRVTGTFFHAIAGVAA